MTLNLNVKRMASVNTSYELDNNSTKIVDENKVLELRNQMIVSMIGSCVGGAMFLGNKYK